jgi:glycine betaine/proline transport system substrate-binding protein
LSLVLVMAAALAVGCAADRLGGNGITMGYLGWDENVANSNLLKVILEDEFGYERVDLKLVDLKAAFDGVAAGELDAFTDVWMPNHKDLVAGVEGEAELSEEPWYLGRTEYGIAVPEYMETRSIADLNSSGADAIVGIEPDAVLMIRIGEKVIPEYDLDLDLVEASTPAMLSELETAYSQEEPFVFLAWSPHWMNADYDFRYLEDPKDTMGELDQRNELHSLLREGLEEDDPVAYALINAMRLDEEQIETLELSINAAGEPEKGAREWLEKEENRSAVQPWIEAAGEA